MGWDFICTLYKGPNILIGGSRGAEIFGWAFWRTLPRTEVISQCCPLFRVLQNSHCTRWAQQWGNRGSKSHSAVSTPGQCWNLCQTVTRCVLATNWRLDFDAFLSRLVLYSLVRYLYPHVTDEKTKAQRHLISYPKPHSSTHYFVRSLRVLLIFQNPRNSFSMNVPRSSFVK